MTELGKTFIFFEFGSETFNLQLITIRAAHVRHCCSMSIVLGIKMLSLSSVMYHVIWQHPVTRLIARLLLIQILWGIVVIERKYHLILRHIPCAYIWFSIDKIT